MTNNDLQQKCRICLQQYRNMEPLFELFYETFSLADILQNITSIKIEKYDYMPQSICLDCTTTLVKFNNLLTTFQDNEMYFIENVCKKERDSSLVTNNEVQHNNPDRDNLANDSLNKDAEDNKPSVGEKEKINNFEEKSRNTLEMLMNMEEIEVTKYSCSKCGDCFIHKYSFNLHMVRKHDSYLDNNQFDKYGSKITIKIPKAFPQVIRKPTNLKCKICKIVTFPTREELNKHLEIHKVYKCDKCDMRFTRKYYLTSHVAIHSNVRQFACTLCNKSFKCRRALKNHKDSHTSVREFVCHTCGMAFTAKGTLRMHMKLKHSQEKNYPCPQCELSFKVKSWLDQHLTRKHSGVRKKDFICSLCGVSYFNKGSLQIHISHKHSENPQTYTCTFCEKVYTLKNNLNNHIQRKHKYLEI